MTRNIGIPITTPKKECTDKHCPFHGILSVRGKLFEGKVVSAKAKNTIVLQKESPVSLVFSGLVSLVFSGLVSFVVVEVKK